MAYSSRSPYVIGAHFYAKYGYDEALRHVSTNLSPQVSDQDGAFWKSVLGVLEDLHMDETQGNQACAALKPKRPPFAIHMNVEA